MYQKPSPLQEEKILLIERGSGVGVISQKLLDENIIDKPAVFKVAARILGRHADLKAGEYQFTPGMSMAAMMEMLHEGKVYDRKLTIPEGLTSYQVVQILNAEETLGGDVITNIPKEGSLLPETYHYISTDTKADQILHMQQAMAEALAELWPQRVENLPFETKKEALTLASIVEKETGVASERSRVAGVFVNRLRRGIALQTDPTVIYAMTMGEVQDNGMGPLGRRLLKKDLEYDSPYNTYKYPGLPPGPIANPGRAAIAATLNPEEHDFVYFVADGTGGHVFAKTLDEHNRNVAKWRKIRRLQ